MRSKKIRLSIVILFVLGLLFAAVFGSLMHMPARAETDGEEGSTDKVIIETNYWFEHIDVAIEVRKDKTLVVRESLQVGFIRGGKNTGIIRDIQRISQTTRIINGESQSGQNYLAGLSDVAVTIDGEPALVTQSYYDGGSFFSVKMQKPDQSYFDATDQANKTGFHDFVLSYVYDLSQDKAKGYDDFTFDVLGYAMAYTRTFTANIVFPEDTDLTQTSFRTNRKEAWIPNPDEGEEVRREDNTISIVARPYTANRGYTVQVILPDGYFEVAGTYQFWYYWVFVAISVCALLVGLVLFYQYCPRKPLEVLEVSPPAGMRAMRYSSIWHGGARTKDVAAVITQWADEGYVRIEQDGKKDLLIHKLKELPETISQEERAYFDAMFPKGDWEGCEVFSTKLMRNGGYAMRDSAMRIALQNIVKDADTPKPLKKGNMLAHFLMTVCAFLPILMTFVYFCILDLTGIPLLFCIFVVAGTAVGSMQAHALINPIAYVFPVAFTAIPYGAFWATFYMSLYDYAGLLWIALAIWAVMLVLMHFLTRRSPEAQKELGNLRGFKRFLLTAELSRIERMFLDDPDYFSHIIPYCLIMGISDKVFKRFKPLNITLPEWAQAVSAGGFSHFARSLSSSGGGGSHGGGGGHGGSSGGGGGGGGSRGC